MDPLYHIDSFGEGFRGVRGGWGGCDAHSYLRVHMYSCSCLPVLAAPRPFSNLSLSFRRLRGSTIWPHARGTLVHLPLDVGFRYIYRTRMLAARAQIWTVLRSLTSCIRLSNSEWTTCKSEARGCRGWAPPVAQRLLSARYVRARCNGPALTPVFHPPRLAPGASRPFSNPARRDRRKNLLRRAAPPRCTGCSSLVLRGPATQRRPAAAEQPCLGCTAPWPRRHRQPVTAGTCGSLAPRACRLRRRLCVECM